jgi:hypothetical protein
MAIVIEEKDREKAFALFDQGESVGRVATLCFGAHWYKAKKVREEYDKREAPAPSAEQQCDEICDVIGGQIDIESINTVDAETVEHEPELTLAELWKQEPDDAEPAAEPEVWDITVQLSIDRMNQIISKFTLQEKADAISMVLTARLSAEA